MALTVYKSSAGSGKTFTLVKEYVKLLIKRPQDFKHILAITFTNKATEEMKTRILKALEEMGAGKETQLFKILVTELAAELTPLNIQQRAEEAYDLIIHNYGRFEVSTIDSFFSRVLKSFARELDLPLSYEVEMNTSMALQEAMNELFKSLDDNKEVRQWLTQYAKEQIESDKSWNVDQQIEKLGGNLFRESFQDGFSGLNLSFDELKTIIESLRSDIKSFEVQLKKYGNEALDLISQHGLQVADFSGGQARSVANTFVKLTNKDYKLTSTFIKTVNGDSNWYAQKSDKKAEIDQLVSGRFGEICQGIVDFIEDNESDYNSAKAILKNVYAFGLLEELNKYLKEYRDEHNVMLISDTNIILKDILEQADAPFIFEKLGSFYKHIMIDEFQDTSNFQWSNLKPLIINALSEDNEVLIVGDVKQSIYRFRGGNMRLLLSQVKEELGAFYPKEADQVLNDNWRSLSSIVNFNNNLFGKLPEAFGKNEVLHDTSLFTQAYENHEQQIQGGEGGYVQMRYYSSSDEEDEKWQTQSVKDLLIQIRENKEKGFSLSDMLILVNRNKEISDIATAFLSEKIPFINGESLKLQQSESVLFVLELLRYLQSGKDEVLMLNLISLFFRLNDIPEQAVMLRGKGERMTLEEAGFPQEFLTRQYEIKQFALFDLVSELLLMFDIEKKADVYLQQLLDVILEQSQRGANSINTFLEWWDKEGDNQTVATSEKTNAIRILTIHKSKGLESPIVFIPFANWDILPNANTHQFWTKNIPEQYQSLQYIPLDFSKSTLLKSYFQEDYYTEATESALDILNKTYVAFTRPREKLYLAAPMPKKAGSSRIHEFLLDLLPEIGLLSQEESTYTQFSLGTDGQKIGSGEEIDASVAIGIYPQVSFLNQLTIRNDSERFFMLQETEEAQNISLGNQVHEVLSAIRVKEDLEMVLRQFLQAGELDHNAIALVKDRILRLFDDPKISVWFSDDYEVFNEREIWFEGKAHKPDRLLIKGKEAVIIDYKKEKESSAHQEQVKRYMNAMKALGYEQVSGHLIYVEPVIVKEVVNG
ncbi:UvrD-helicase domain-containing protein [uncultured Roseivirga sp.]|uniref:UvrD-helicase domain-containing protein n=1 Tax=uncultured Roseivirga sp. TaxID=543088 RepID=UPI0030DAA4A4